MLCQGITVTVWGVDTVLDAHILILGYEISFLLMLPQHCTAVLIGLDGDMQSASVVYAQQPDYPRNDLDHG